MDFVLFYHDINEMFQINVCVYMCVWCVCMHGVCVSASVLCVLFDRKLADGLFLESCRQVSKGYPDIEFTDMIIDNASMQVRPTGFMLLLVCM